MNDNLDVKITVLINKVFHLSKIKHKNKDWWKKDFSNDVLLFFNLSWICMICLFYLDEIYLLTSWIGIILTLILFLILFVGLLISYATWTEAKQIQSLNE